MSIYRNIYLHDFSQTLKHRARSRKHVGPYQWKPADRTLANGRNRPFDGRGFYMDSQPGLMARHGAGVMLRLEADGTGQHWSGVEGEDGWYAIALRLPHGRGFLAGASLGAGMCATCDGEIYAELGDALYAGREIARCAAEADAEAEEDFRASENATA
jgi:hypothetical protein